MEQLSELFQPMWLLAILMIGYSLARLWAKKRSTQLRQIFEELAGRNGGVVEMEGGMPSVKVSWNNIEMWIRFRSISQRPTRQYTEMKAKFTCSPRSEILLDKWGGSLDKLVGSCQPRTGDEEFDSQFSVKCDDEVWLNHILNANLRHSILDFVDRSPSFRIHWDASSLTLWRYGVPENIEALQQFLSSATQVVTGFASTKGGV